MRVLGKGLTAQGVKKRFPDAILYDNSDFNLYDKNSEDITIVSPGIPPSNEMVLNSKNIQSDYDLVTMPFSIWISGTNGKTTTTQMLQHLFKDKGSLCGGNIGTPICQLDEQAPLWIIETSSFTMHYIKNAKPNLYILLPISEDHISWHGSFEEYQKAKLKPLSLMKEGDVAIIPDEFKDIKSEAFVITYKSSNSLETEFNIDANKINFKEPFLIDAILALSCEKILFDEVSYSKINSFKVDEHKIEEFRDNKNRLWIDDSKATNIDATISALYSYKTKRILLILGGDDKGANLIPLFEYLKDLDIELFNIGSNAKRLDSLSKKYKIKFNSCKTVDIAVNKISQKHGINTVAILSPAAASLDQFSSYKHRGKEFKKVVNSLSLI